MEIGLAESEDLQNGRCDFLRSNAFFYSGPDTEFRLCPNLGQPHRFRRPLREETVSPQPDHSDQNYVRIAVRSYAMPLDFRLVWITVVWDFYLELVAYAESGLDQGEFRN